MATWVPFISECRVVQMHRATITRPLLVQKAFLLGAASTLDWTAATVDLSKLSDFFKGPGVYEMTVTVKDTVSGSVSSRSCFITLMDVTTTTKDISTSTSKLDLQTSTSESDVPRTSFYTHPSSTNATTGAPSPTEAPQSSPALSSSTISTTTTMEPLVSSSSFPSM
ncbi:hypothetical protein COOONC_16994 [Cooperia oncophora]